MKYEIKGGNFPVVICTCDAGEKLLCEAGAMSWMSANMKMSTNMTGGLGKAFGRMFSGESMFMNSYEAQGGEGMIAFASTMPGEIRAIKVEPGKDVILQKRAFLAAESGVELSVFLQKRLGSGFFGGEGFIMEKVSGEGMVFAEIDGSAVEYIHSRKGTESSCRYRICGDYGCNLHNGSADCSRCKECALWWRGTI